MEPETRTLSAAVREHLRQLCLHEFPCGTGSWNKSRFLPQTSRAWRELIPRQEKALSPGEETVEDLLGLVRSAHSPWALVEGSSAEDLFLKELAIQNPLMLKDSFFYTYFRSLRVVDKDVSLVDKELLKFVKLEELVLSTLQHLRLLLLQGNPLALVPHYRGFTIDSLARLCVLDDITVASSEKHLFRGLSHSEDLLAPEAQILVTVGNLRGVLDSSVLDPEPGPQGPFITYNYYVTYDFVEDEEGEGSQYSGVLAEIIKPPSSLEQLGEDILEEIIEDIEESSESGLASLSELGEMEESIVSGASEPLPQSIGSAEELAKLRPLLDPRLCPSPGTVLFSTVPKPWSDVIPCNYELQHTLKDLVPLKAFLLSGTTVTVVEEKILSWPVEQPPSSDSPLAAKKGKGEKDKKEKEKDKKDKKGKDKKELPKEMHQDPPILRVLGSSPVVLEALLAGESFVSTVCNFGVIRTLEADRLTLNRDAKKNKKGKKDVKSLVSVFESDYQPEPLTVEIQIQLIQWRSTEEALRGLVI
uniref:Leucine rich repeat containing 43 n=1 Tax=Capra hircus TaxID=9925 RepID=A0A8C2SBH6_CAPHI